MNFSIEEAREHAAMERLREHEALTKDTTLRDVEAKISTINRLLGEVRAFRAAHPETVVGYYISSVGSLLNAYREGDISFDDCVKLLRPADPLPTTQATKSSEASNNRERDLRSPASEPDESATSPTPSETYHCSCGAACSADEYIDHYFNKGHDHGEPVLTESEDKHDSTQDTESAPRGHNRNDTV